MQGVDILPQLKDTVEHTPLEKIESLFGEEVLKDPKVRTELRNTLRIFRETGMLPSPYLQYYWFTDEILEQQIRSGRTRAQEVMQLEQVILDECRKAAAGKRPFEALRGGKRHADMMVGMLGAIADDTREVFIVNTTNRGALPELPYDKIVEVPAVVDARGAHPLAMGTMPVQVRGLIQAVAAYEELAVEAALAGSYGLALDALSCHPLVPSRKLAKSILDDYMAAHGESLAYLK